MKQIIKNTPNLATINLSEFRANTDFYYGVGVIIKFDKTHTYKGLVVREKHEAGPYHIVCTKGLTRHNGWNGWASNSIEELAAKVVNGGDSFFEFKTFEELTDWLNA